MASHRMLGAVTSVLASEPYGDSPALLALWTVSPQTVDTPDRGQLERSHLGE
jgi:hypothetical protein